MNDIPDFLSPWREVGGGGGGGGGGFWDGVPVEKFVTTVAGGKPDQGTSVQVAWTEEELRVRFEAEDTDAWATMTAPKSLIYEEEVVEIFLDSVGDLESYYEIEVNPLNTVLDLVLRRNRSGYLQDFKWVCEGLRTSVELTSKGWVTNVEIPWRSVSLGQPRAGDRWRVNFCRIDRPKGKERELTSWSHLGRANFHTPERFGILHFVR